LLIALQIVGEAISFLSPLPIPGPVIGMVLLLCGLIIKGNLPEQLDVTCQNLLRHLSLLFVPAGVGVTAHFSLLATEWLPITASIIIATLFTIAFSGLMMKFLDKKTNHG